MTHKEFIGTGMPVLLFLLATALGVLGWFIRALLKYRSDHEKRHEDLKVKSIQDFEEVYARIRDSKKESEEKFMTKESYALAQERVEDILARIEARDARTSDFLEKMLEKYTDGHLDHETRLTRVETEIQ